MFWLLLTRDIWQRFFRINTLKTFGVLFIVLKRKTAAREFFQYATIFKYNTIFYVEIWIPKILNDDFQKFIFLRQNFWLF